MGTDGADILVNDRYFTSGKSYASFPVLYLKTVQQIITSDGISANVAGYREMSYPNLNNFCGSVKALATEDATLSKLPKLYRQYLILLHVNL
jgi:hypothetical protein